jgi:hypothetical protein
MSVPYVCSAKNVKNAYMAVRDSSGVERFFQLDHGRAYDLNPVLNKQYIMGVMQHPSLPKMQDGISLDALLAQLRSDSAYVILGANINRPYLIQPTFRPQTEEINGQEVLVSERRTGILVAAIQIPNTNANHLKEYIA